MKKMCFMLMILMAAGLVSAGTLTSGTTAPTGVIASGVPGAPSWTRIETTGRTDDNYGRGNEILADNGYSIDGATMDALVIRKDAAQDFTGSTATLTLYVFEGTKEMWDAGDGQGDGDLFDGTGITNFPVNGETFALNDSYAEGDYIILTLDTPITMAADMGWFIQMTQGDANDDFFQIAQKNTDFVATARDGIQYQSKTNGNIITASPLEYYVVGTNPTVPGNVTPTGDAIDPETTTTITWVPPTAYTPEVGYDLIVREATEGSGEPNFLAADNIIEILDASAASPETVSLSDITTYWCSLTAYEPNGVASDSTDDIPHTLVWSFKTIDTNWTPDVTLYETVTGTRRYVTWPDEFPDDLVADVNDFGEGDIDTVTWEIDYGPGVPISDDAMMMDRVNQLGKISDPNKQNLFRDWIGTKCNNGEATSDVLNLTLSGLPSGSYTWKSYHYDAYPHSSTDVFDVIVNGSTVATGVAQSAGISEPNVFETTITSDGPDSPVTLQFVGYNDAISKLFTMNAFELTSTEVMGDWLYVDFSKRQTYPDPNFVQAGYLGYLGISGDLESFGTQSFGAFGTTVTVTPDWYAPSIDITEVIVNEPDLTWTATVDIAVASKILGTYSARCRVTDTADQMRTRTVIIGVAEDACAAAQFIDPDFEFELADADQDCDVDLQDLAAFAAQWLNDLALTGPTAY